MKIRVFKVGPTFHFAVHDPAMVGRHHSDPGVSRPHLLSRGYTGRIDAFRAGIAALAETGTPVTGLAGSGSDVRRFAREQKLDYQDIRGNQRRSSRGTGKPV